MDLEEHIARELKIIQEDPFLRGLLSDVALSRYVPQHPAVQRVAKLALTGDAQVKHWLLNAAQFLPGSVELSYAVNALPEHAIMGALMGRKFSSIHSHRDYQQQVLEKFIIDQVIKDTVAGPVSVSGFAGSRLERDLQQGRGVILACEHSEIVRNFVVLFDALRQQNPEFAYRIRPIIGNNLIEASEGVGAHFGMIQSLILNRSDVTATSTSRGYSQRELVDKIVEVTNKGGIVWASLTLGRAAGMETVDPRVVGTLTATTSRESMDERLERVPLYVFSAASELRPSIEPIARKMRDKQSGGERVATKHTYSGEMMHELQSWVGETRAVFDGEGIRGPVEGSRKEKREKVVSKVEHAVWRTTPVYPTNELARRLELGLGLGMDPFTDSQVRMLEQINRMEESLRPYAIQSYAAPVIMKERLAA